MDPDADEMEVPVSFAVRVPVGMGNAENEEGADQQVEAYNRRNQQLEAPRMSRSQIQSVLRRGNHEWIGSPPRVHDTDRRMLSKPFRPVN